MTDEDAPTTTDEIPEPGTRGTAHVCLVSGGEDSAASAAVAAARGVDLFVYLDTRTGLDANREYVEDLADHLGAHLWTLRTPESYADAVRENGFPSPSDHSIMYRLLKERQIERLATLAGGRGQASGLYLWTGVRRQESRNRMGYVEPVQEADRWTWVAPLHDADKARVREIIEEEDLPRNPLWGALGRSGDCYCGAFASRAELLDLEAAGFDEHAATIRRLEDEVKEAATDPTSRALWGWGKMDPRELRAARAEMDEAQALLCSDCGPPA